MSAGNAVHLVSTTAILSVKVSVAHGRSCRKTQRLNQNRGAAMDSDFVLFSTE
jgi:hypothetical protein